MKSDHFRVTWEAEDGFVSGSRPHSFKINAEELDSDDERSLHDYFWEYVQDEFTQHVSPTSDDEERFIAWAKQKIAERNAEAK